MLSEKRLFQNRNAKRAHKHGKNWRQVFVNCGGMCLKCFAVDTLEFHEPFGEDKLGWGILQSRVILCHDCHMGIEHQDMFNGMRYIRPSQLSDDVAIEIMVAGGYDNWIKKFNLEDTFGRLLI